MPASGIYRYFVGKSDILAAAFRRAADRLSAEMSAVLNSVADREQALTQLTGPADALPQLGAAPGNRGPAAGSDPAGPL
jgi:AcrR family transcriptional regulator